MDEELDFKTLKKEIYIPLKKILELVIKRIKTLDLNIPIVKIARMDLEGKFQNESLEPLRKTIHDYLKIANNYRSVYFEYMKKTKTYFDKEMNTDGSFAPGLKQYNSLKILLSEALLKNDNKAWIMSYDQYLPTIREHANKRSKHPRSGKKMFEVLKSKCEKDLKEIRKFQKLTIQISKLFIKDLDYAMKNPELSWQEWLINDNTSK
jgi:hypothetical protein